MSLNIIFLLTLWSEHSKNFSILMFLAWQLNWWLLAKKAQYRRSIFLNLKVEEFFKNKTFKLEPNLECDKFVVWTQRYLTGRDWQTDTWLEAIVSGEQREGQ